MTAVPGCRRRRPPCSIALGPGALAGPGGAGTIPGGDVATWGGAVSSGAVGKGIDGT